MRHCDNAVNQITGDQCAAAGERKKPVPAGAAATAHGTAGVAGASEIARSPERFELLSRASPNSSANSVNLTTSSLPGLTRRFHLTETTHSFRWMRGSSSQPGKKAEMLFAHLKRILRLGRLRLRGPNGAQFEFTLAAIAQNLRRLAKLVARPPPGANLCALREVAFSR